MFGPFALCLHKQNSCFHCNLLQEIQKGGKTQKNKTTLGCVSMAASGYSRVTSIFEEPKEVFSIGSSQYPGAQSEPIVNWSLETSILLRKLIM